MTGGGRRGPCQSPAPVAPDRVVVLEPCRVADLPNLDRCAGLGSAWCVAVSAEGTELDRDSIVPSGDCSDFVTTVCFGT